MIRDMLELPTLPARSVRRDELLTVEGLTVTESLKYSPMVTRAVAVMEV